MKNLTFINPDYIDSVKVSYETPSNYTEYYKAEDKSLFKTPKEERWADPKSNEKYNIVTKSQALESEQYKIKNNRLYLSPIITIYLGLYKRKYIKYFESDSELKEFLNNLHLNRFVEL